MAANWKGLNDKKYLTPREAEVVCLLAEGLTPKNVARKLDLSYWTVMNHISHMERRLDSNGYDLVHQANILGILK